MNNPYTENLGDFGYREIALLKDILVAWCDGTGLPSTFENSGIKPAMNRNSGNVFLVNDEYQTVMINPETGNLEVFHNTPYNGHEGFLTDLMTEHAPEDLNVDDVDYIKNTIEIEMPANVPDVWQKIVDGE